MRIDNLHSDTEARFPSEPGLFVFSLFYQPLRVCPRTPSLCMAQVTPARDVPDLDADPVQRATSRGHVMRGLAQGHSRSGNSASLTQRSECRPV